MTNKGLYITLPVICLVETLHVAILACHREGDFYSPVGIRVVPVPGDENQTFVRHSDSLEGSLVNPADFRVRYLLVN